MPLEGCQLNRKQALSLCRAAGFTGTRLVQACAIMGAESARYTRAYYVNEPGSVDRGLFQINSRWHPDLDDEQAYNPWLNVRYAFGMSNGGRNWSPWASYGNAAYLAGLVTFSAELARKFVWKVPMETRVARIREQGEAYDPCRESTAARAAR